MNKIIINFVTCTPPPANGYRVYYRESGSSNAFILAGIFFSSPAIFYDDVNPPGTCYEGYIASDCGDDVLGNHILFDTCSSSAIEMDNSSCGTSIEQETIALTYVDLGLFTLHVEGAVTVNIAWQTYDRPNRFTLYEDGVLISTTGWKGYAPYGGPWGASLSTVESGNITFNPLPGKVYQIRIEAGPAGASPYDVSDNFVLDISCS